MRRSKITEDQIIGVLKEHWAGSCMAELNRVRPDSGLTEAALATKLGVAKSYVIMIEEGKRRLDVVEFINWLDAAEALILMVLFWHLSGQPLSPTHDKNGKMS